IQRRRRRAWSGDQHVGGLPLLALRAGRRLAFRHELHRKTAGQGGNRSRAREAAVAGRGRALARLLEKAAEGTVDGAAPSRPSPSALASIASSAAPSHLALAHLLQMSCNCEI